MKRPPEEAESLTQLGNARRAAGQLADAAMHYRRSLEIAPDYAAARYNLGLVLVDLGQPLEAEPHFLRLRESDPLDADVLFHLALIASGRAQPAAAAQLYRDALALTPDNPGLWLGLAAACRELPGQREESVRCLHKCLELDPDSADAHRMLGDLVQAEARLDDAIGHYRAAIRSTPENAALHCQLGNAMMKTGQWTEAIACYQKALQLDPDLATAHLNLGSARGLMGAHDEALRSYEAALRLDPGNAAIRGNLMFEKQRMCDWSGFEALCERQRADAIKDARQEVPPFNLLYIPSTAAEQLQCARHYARRQSIAIARDSERLRFPPGRRASGRVRIGYLSADFREHPVASLVAEVFELHDRSRFEIFAYAYGPNDNSPMRRRIEQAFDQFSDIAALAHADAATRIHVDQVDILVDLTGYTAFGRPEIAALRPAPVQVNYLGYPGTMGAEFMDYIVTDRFITPPGRESQLSEQPVYLPGTYQPNDRKRSVAATPSRSELGLPQHATVFCCFNHTYKILPGVFETWMRLLQAVPGSILWLLKSNPWAEQNLLREARRGGLNADRLVFAPMLPREQHLARLRAADLFLDTQPYNAHTTASDALWAGLPVVTCAGDTFASRVAGSLLTAVGLPELVTHSMEAYEALTLRLARDTAELAALREKLARNRNSAPLFDTPAYTRHLETAYQRMWENHLAGSPPRAIEL